MNVELAILVLRVVVGGVVAMHGFLKLGWVGKGGSIAGVAGWFNGMGLRPGIFWAIVATLAEAGGGTLPVPRLRGAVRARGVAGGPGVGSHLPPPAPGVRGPCRQGGPV